MATSVDIVTDQVYQQCLSPDCSATYDVGEVHTACPSAARCWTSLTTGTATTSPSRSAGSRKSGPAATSRSASAASGGSHELLPFAPPDKIVTIGEGQTLLQRRRRRRPVRRHATPASLFLQYEGMNPSGSFKDNGMTAAFTHAHMLGAKRAACASTGNTSASLALYCGVSKLMQAVIFIGSGKIAYGKLSQALDYGALTLQIAGDFDDAMRRVQQVSTQARHLPDEQRQSVPARRPEDDHVPRAGGLRLGSARLDRRARRQPRQLAARSARRFIELHELGLIDRIPRLAVINAAGANTLYELYEQRGLRWNGGRPDAAIVNNYYAELDDANRRASTRSPAPSRSTGR